jgi:uncharacterized protein with PQ loop repeat
VNGLGESIEIEPVEAPKDATQTAVVTVPHSASFQLSSSTDAATHAMSPSWTHAVTPLSSPYHESHPPIVKHIVTDHSGFETSKPWHMWSTSSLLTTVSFAAFVKSMCIAGNMMVQLSPFPQVLRWKSQHSTGHSDAAPFVAIAFGGAQWSFYGLLSWIVTRNHGFLVLVQANFLGAVLGTYYLFEFYRNCSSELSLSRLRKYLTAVFMLVLVELCGVISLSPERAVLGAGLISSLCSVLGASAVLVTLAEVIRSKDARSIPGLFAFASLCSSIMWCFCGCLLHDRKIAMPALIHICFTTVALYCKVAYMSADICKEEGLEHVDLFEDCGSKMGRMKLAIKMELPVHPAPISRATL